VRNGPAISFYVNGNLDATFGAAADANPSEAGSTRFGSAGRTAGGVTGIEWDDR